MLTIDSIKVRSDVRYALVAVAVLLSVAAVVLAYDSSGADVEGGGTATEAPKEVVYYDSGFFIDKEGYYGGDAKLIYEEHGPGVKVVGIERGSTSTSYIEIPESIYCVDTGVQYTVVGDIVQKTGDNTYVSDDSNYGLIHYTVIEGYAWITEMEYFAISYFVFHHKITCGDEEFKVAGVLSSCFIPTGDIESLNILIDFDDDLLSYSLPDNWMENNDSIRDLSIIASINWTKWQDTALNIGEHAFKDCTSLQSLYLPYNVTCPGEAFMGCTSLGSGNTSENPFFLNTYFQTSKHMFSGCTGLEYLELGPNFSTFDCSDELFPYCPNLKVVYNSSAYFAIHTAQDLIVASGSKHVLLFNNPGGEFTQRASVTYADDGYSITNITLPKATTSDGFDAPAWCHNDTSTWYNSGNQLDTSEYYFIHWGPNNEYYYDLNTRCTVTYHVYNEGKEISTATQTVWCMYNTSLYGQGTYPDTEVSLPEEFTWTSTSGFTFSSGQPVTLFGDLELYVWLDGIKPETFDVTCIWDYFDTSGDITQITRYTYTMNIASGTTVIPDKDFFNGIGASDELIAEFYKYGGFWLAKGGWKYSLTYGNATFLNYSYSAFVPIVYHNDNDSTLDAICYGSSAYKTVNPNFFTYDSEKHFVGWGLYPDSCQHLPGDSVVARGWVSYWAFCASGDVVVTYVYNNGEGDTTADSPYGYGLLSDLETFPDETPRGKKLIGWGYTPDHLNFPIGTQVKMINNLKLYAVYEKVTEPLSVIVDDLFLSADDLSGIYDVSYTVIGTLSDGENVVPTVTYGTDPEPPTAVGVYAMTVECKVVNSDGDDVTGYYEIAVISDSFLTIYRGDHSTVID